MSIEDFTNIYYDFEFLEDGKTIMPISLGMVAMPYKDGVPQDSDYIYRVWHDADWDRVSKNRWLCENVVAQLPLRDKMQSSEFGNNIREYYFNINDQDPSVYPGWVIARQVEHFITKYDNVRLYAYYAAYDHVCLAQMYGTMMNLPKGIPMYTHDLKCLAEEHGIDMSRAPKQEKEHNALNDALWNAHLHQYIWEERKKQKSDYLTIKPYELSGDEVQPRDQIRHVENDDMEFEDPDETAMSEQAYAEMKMKKNDGN